MRRLAIARPVAVFRCDASPAIGAGHVVRCLALAQVLAEAGWQITFATGPQTVSSVPALHAGGFRVLVLDEPSEREPLAIAGHIAGGADLLIVDHYGRGSEFEQACRAWARRILVLDDATGRAHDCDMLVDAAAVDQARYHGRVPPHADILCGPAFALTRRSYLAHRETALARRDGRPVRDLLVSFGAGDPLNVIPIVLDTVSRLAPGLHLTVAISAHAPHIGEVRGRLRGHRLLVDVDDLAEPMTNADLAFGAAGMSAFERAVLGLPSVLVPIADNQRNTHRLMVEAGAALDGGTIGPGLVARIEQCLAAALGDSTARIRMARAALALADGRGAFRLLATIAGACWHDGARIRLRLAEAADEEWLLELQREPDTRRHARNPEIPSADEHARWLGRTFRNPDRLLLIVDADGENVGMVRLDRACRDDDGARYEISIAMSGSRRRRGIGATALALVRRLMPGAVLEAEIMPDNVASRRLFGAAGFRQVGDRLYRNLPQ